MEEGFENVYHQVETTHFWFRSRRSYILDLIKEADKDSKILDIGCSSGILLEELISNGFNPKNLYGIDISENAIRNCQLKGLKNTFVMDAQHIELNETFDYIISSDCLEHLEDDSKALVNWRNLLITGGNLFVFVPAYMMLWSEHDVANMHYRRYTRKGLVTELKKAGFEIKKSSYWNFLLFFPVLALRIISRLIPSKGENKDGDLNQNPIGNSFFFSLIYFENKMLSKVNFPFGISTFCIANKSTN